MEIHISRHILFVGSFPFPTPYLSVLWYFTSFDPNLLRYFCCFCFKSVGKILSLVNFVTFVVEIPFYIMTKIYILWYGTPWMIGTSHVFALSKTRTTEQATWWGNSNTYIRRYVDNNRYSRYYYVGIYVCMYYVLSTKILVR